MKYNTLDLKTKQTSKRLGRGIASGKGKTAGRGTKGQGARAGSSRRPGFSGGQNPLMQQLPKLPGFRSLRVKSDLVFTDQLDSLKKKVVDSHLLYDAKLVSSPFVKIKLLFRGEVKSAMEVKLPLASTTAVDALQNGGGTFTKVDVSQRVAKLEKSKEKDKL